jgi:hypothetical protein
MLFIMNRTNVLSLLTICLLCIAASAFAQPFRTPLFTGNAYNDFTAAERAASTGSLNYEMTWDASGLFVGVSALSSYAKDEPNIYYFDTDPQANPTAGTGSTTGFNNYNGRTGTLPFTANMVVFLKNGYCEMRKWTGSAWSSQTVLVVTYFGANDAELYIPWTEFPGAARPAKLRYTIFKVNNDNSATDAYDIYPTNAGAIASYIPNVNTTPFPARQFVDIYDTSNGKTAQTLTGSCPTVTIGGGACIGDGFALLKFTPDLGCTYDVTVTNTTTSTPYTYTGITTAGGFSSMGNLEYSISNLPGTTNALPIGSYQITNVVANGCTTSIMCGAAAYPFSSTPITVDGNNANITLASTTNSTMFAGNGSITIGGLVPSRVYTVKYTLGGNIVTTPSITANASGQLVVANLQGGSYSNIEVLYGTCPSFNTLSAVLTGPVCAANAGTFPWDGN